jgi:hypothetical protein
VDSGFYIDADGTRVSPVQIGKMALMSVEHALVLEESSGHKKMRMEPIARLHKKTPLKQVRDRSKPPRWVHADQLGATATRPLPWALAAA